MQRTSKLYRWKPLPVSLSMHARDEDLTSCLSVRNDRMAKPLLPLRGIVPLPCIISQMQLFYDKQEETERRVVLPPDGQKLGGLRTTFFDERV
jgi:hypothetical protein